MVLLESLEFNNELNLDFRQLVIEARDQETPSHVAKLKVSITVSLLLLYVHSFIFFIRSILNQERDSWESWPDEGACLTYMCCKVLGSNSPWK